jgi:hypothetical protein
MRGLSFFDAERRQGFTLAAANGRISHSSLPTSQ